MNFNCDYCNRTTDKLVKLSDIGDMKKVFKRLKGHESVCTMCVRKAYIVFHKIPKRVLYEAKYKREKALEENATHRTSNEHNKCSTKVSCDKYLKQICGSMKSKKVEDDIFKKCLTSNSSHKVSKHVATKDKSENKEGITDGGAFNKSNHEKMNRVDVSKDNSASGHDRLKENISTENYTQKRISEEKNEENSQQKKLIEPSTFEVNCNKNIVCEKLTKDVPKDTLEENVRHKRLRKNITQENIIHRRTRKGGSAKKNPENSDQEKIEDIGASEANYDKNICAQEQQANTLKKGHKKTSSHKKLRVNIKKENNTCGRTKKKFNEENNGFMTIVHPAAFDEKYNQYISDEQLKNISEKHEENSRREITKENVSAEKCNQNNMYKRIEENSSKGKQEKISSDILMDVDTFEENHNQYIGHENLKSDVFKEGRKENSIYERLRETSVCAKILDQNSDHEKLVEEAVVDDQCNSGEKINRNIKENAISKGTTNSFIHYILKKLSPSKINKTEGEVHVQHVESNSQKNIERVVNLNQHILDNEEINLGCSIDNSSSIKSKGIVDKCTTINNIQNVGCKRKIHCISEKVVEDDQNVMLIESEALFKSPDNEPIKKKKCVSEIKISHKQKSKTNSNDLQKKDQSFNEVPNSQSQYTIENLISDDEDDINIISETMNNEERFKDLESQEVFIMSKCEEIIKNLPSRSNNQQEYQDVQFLHKEKGSVVAVPTMSSQNSTIARALNETLNIDDIENVDGNISKKVSPNKINKEKIVQNDTPNKLVVVSQNINPIPQTFASYKDNVKKILANTLTNQIQFNNLNYKYDLLHKENLEDKMCVIKRSPLPEINIRKISWSVECDAGLEFGKRHKCFKSLNSFSHPVCNEQNCTKGNLVLSFITTLSTGHLQIELSGYESHRALFSLSEEAWKDVCYLVYSLGYYYYHNGRLIREYNLLQIKLLDLLIKTTPRFRNLMLLYQKMNCQKFLKLKCIDAVKNDYMWGERGSNAKLGLGTRTSKFLQETVKVHNEIQNLKTKIIQVSSEIALLEADFLCLSDSSEIRRSNMIKDIKIKKTTLASYKKKYAKLNKRVSTLKNN